MGVQNFGKYEIRELIGQGAMGAVHRAWDTSLNRLVAVKTMASSLSADPELKVRFYREAQATAKLQHPNITTIFDYGEAAGAVYIAMEFVDGPSLRDVLNREKIPLERKLGWMIQICRALGFAHRHGIVHRDVKPGNVLINADGLVKILDFGIAHLESSDLTQTGACLGTPEYMSPELVRGQRIDGRSDVFSCGVMFYEMVAGQKPFSGGSLTKLLNEILTADPPPIASLWPGVPAALDEVIRRMLQRDPASRYQDLDEAANDLKDLQSEMILIRAEKVRLLQKTHQELQTVLASTGDTFASAVVNRRFATLLAQRRAGLRSLADLSDSSVGVEQLEEELVESQALLEAVRRFLKKELSGCIRLRDEICGRLGAAVDAGNHQEARRLLEELAEIGAHAGLLDEWRSRLPAAQEVLPADPIAGNPAQSDAVAAASKREEPLLSDLPKPKLSLGSTSAAPDSLASKALAAAPEIPVPDTRGPLTARRLRFWALVAGLVLLLGLIAVLFR